MHFRRNFTIAYTNSLSFLFKHKALSSSEMECQNDHHIQ